MKRKIKLAKMNPELVAREIGDFVVRAVREVGATGGVIGLSGGVDSTTAAALAKKAFDDYNKKNTSKLDLIGYMLPSKLNKEEDTKDGIRVAEKLNLRYEIQNISPIVEAYSFTNPEIFSIKNGFHKGNLMSRIRANILSTKAAVEGKIVLGTGNKDEDFGIGYYTLFGDGAVHLSPIGQLPKRLVKQIASYLGFQDIAKKTPTAGLEPEQTDFKDLGYDYDVVELVIEGIEQGFTLEELIEHEQVKSLVNKQLPKSKFKNIEEVVKDIFRRHYSIALKKAEIIHPPTVPVTLGYEGGKSKYGTFKQCLRENYQGPYMATDILIRYNNKGIVLIERKYSPQGLALPGGIAEEIPLYENAVKEAKEETGLDIKLDTPEKPFCVLSELDQDPREFIASAVYTAEGFGKLQPSKNEDAKSAVLYTKSEISELLKKDVWAFSHHKKILRMYLRGGKNE